MHFWIETLDGKPTKDNLLFTAYKTLPVLSFTSAGKHSHNPKNL